MSESEDYGHDIIITAHLKLIAPSAGLWQWPQPQKSLSLSGFHQRYNKPFLAGIPAAILNTVPLLWKRGILYDWPSNVSCKQPTKSYTQEM